MIILGQPQEVEQESVDPKTLVMHDTMRSTGGWQTASQVDTGNIVGQMGVDNKGFFVEEYDDEKGDRWHGPSLISRCPVRLEISRLTYYSKMRIPRPITA